AQKKRYIYAAFSLLFSVYAFWLIGTKAPILFTLLMILFGAAFNTKFFLRLPCLIGLLLILLLIAGIIENALLGYSYISDYFTRRAFAVVAQMQGAYVSFAIDAFRMEEWVSGLKAATTEPISMVIGK